MYKTLNCVNNLGMEEQKDMENKIKINKRGEKFISFLKKYGYFIVAGIIVLAITLTIVFTTTKTSPNLNIQQEDKQIEETNAYALTFSAPLLDCTIATVYAADELILNETLGWYATHHALDLVSTTSSDVLSAAAGTVIEIYTNSLEGTVVVVKHNDVYTSKYGSLDSKLAVNVGDKVTKGQKLGTTSTSAGNEVLIGSHLHFELFRDNNDVNPADYLNLENK